LIAETRKHGIHPSGSGNFRASVFRPSAIGSAPRVSP
jgi:hypothetical protein